MAYTFSDKIQGSYYKRQGVKQKRDFIAGRLDAMFENFSVKIMPLKGVCAKLAINAIKAIKATILCKNIQ